ncbi:MAG: M14 metallopeptidase family protein [Kofleriaceae bacterium]
MRIADTLQLRGVVVVAALATGLVARAPAPPLAREMAVEVMPRNSFELALTLELALDRWSEHVVTGEPVVVVLSPASLGLLRGIQYRILVDDLEAAAARERDRLATRAQASWFTEYRDLAEIEARMDLLATRDPELVTVTQIGTSVEGRPIRALAISRGGTRGIALDGGQHAREWISVMVPICIADRLVERAAEPRIRKLLEAVRFHLVPVVNPDGYAYTWTHDRYWRKNRRGGFGVDLNRNYSVAWGKAGSSADRSSPNYRGERAFSEPETRAMAALFEREAIVAHVDFHSFSQLVLYPWSHQRTPPKDRDRFAALASGMSSALSAAHGESYKVRAGSELTVGSSGTLGDWAYGVRDALSFLIELRPTPGNAGFVLPPEQIVPTCDESLAAVLNLADAVATY